MGCEGPQEKAQEKAQERVPEWVAGVWATKFIFTKLASAPSSTFQGTTSREELTILMRRNFHSHSIFS